MVREHLKALVDALHQAQLQRIPIAPLTTLHPDLSIDDAYDISLALLDRRLALGERVVGKKIGVTSQAVMDMLDVRQPDFGFLTDAMRYDGEMPISEKLIQPRAEGELAFLLRSPLQGPGVTHDQVLAATEAVFPCFEVVDSRIEDWKIAIQDTVADNASCGLFTINETAAIDPRVTDLANVAMTVFKNGSVVSQGTGAAAMGDPVNCVVWLANTLGRYGISLNAGDIILSGSLVPLEPVVPGDVMSVVIEDAGECVVTFT